VEAVLLALAARVAAAAPPEHVHSEAGAPQSVHHALPVAVTGAVGHKPGGQPTARLLPRKLRVISSELSDPSHKCGPRPRMPKLDETTVGDWEVRVCPVGHAPVEEGAQAGQGRNAGVAVDQRGLKHPVDVTLGRY